MEVLDPRFVLLSGALIIGAVYGIVARLSGFCLRSALIELFERRAGHQVTAWGTAVLFAVVGTQSLSALGLIDLTGSIYLADTLLWGGAVLGGVMFGFGMMLTRGCASRHIILAMAGNLRSWMVLVVMGLVSYMTLRGILGPLRLQLEAATTINLGDMGKAGMNVVGIVAPEHGVALEWSLLALVVGLFSLFLLRRAVPRGGQAYAVAGAAIGLLIPCGWYLTGVLGFDSFEPTPLTSLTFVAPVGNAIQYLMTYTGASSDFGIASVGGVLLGTLAITILRN